MASCYGKTKCTSPMGNEVTLQCCSYLPLSKAITLANGTPTQLELNLFQTEQDFEQGFKLMNDVIIEGKTWPFLEVFDDIDGYKSYFHSHSAFAVKEKDGNEVLGCFYIKPNFPGRCSHVCNGGFITNPNYRGYGIGAFMGENFKRLAKDLGYRASLFNLVFANNMASVKLWRKLGYTQLSIIPKVAVLEGSDGYVDAFQFYCDFYNDEPSTV